MFLGSRWYLYPLLFVLVGALATDAWAMRPQDESATRAKPGIEAKPDEVYQAIQRAPADYQAWKAQNLSPAGKTKLQRPAKAAMMMAPAAQSSAVSPDLDVRFDPATGAASFIKVKTSGMSAMPLRGAVMGPSATMEAPAGTPAIAQGSLHQHRSLLRVKDAYQEFTPKHSHIDSLGLTHHKFQQTCKGLPIWGREVWVHLNQQNATYLIEGKVQPTPTLNTQPQLTSDQAIAKAQQDMQDLTEPAADLIVYVDDCNISHLVWHVTARKGFERWHWFVDASYGAVLRRFNDTRYESVGASGADLFNNTDPFSAWHQDNEYTLLDTTLPMHGADPVLPDSLGSGNLVVFDAKHQDPNGQITGYFLHATSPTTGWDTTGVSAMNNFRIITDYYKNTHNRNGIDGQTLNTISFVHVGSGWDNACWTGQVIFIGDGTEFLPLARGLDVLGHEYTHAVIDYTAAFDYQFQSGALHEGLADIFGSMIERKSWLMGEEIIRSGPPLRNLQDPHNAMDPGPATMDEYQNLPYSTDYGGVHANATIPGHAAYLMAEGLGNAIGRDKIEQVFYRALTTHMTSQSNFADCRAATIQSAEELYGTGSAEAKAVTDAWDAVKVTAGSGGGGGGTPIPPATGPDALVFLYTDTGGTPYLGLRTSSGDEYQVSTTPVLEVRPVVTTGGTEVLFVDATNNLRVASLSVNDTYEHVLTTDGTVRTIGGSRNGRYFAYTDNTSYNNKLYVQDHVNAANNKTFDLYLPSVDGEGASLLDHADVLDFDISNKHVIFDAVSKFSVSGAGTAQTFWSVGILDIATGQVSNLVQTQPPGVDIGNPCASSTQDWVIAVDVVDNNADKCETRAINVINGMTGLLSEDTPKTNLGWPSFNGDDTAVAVQYQSNISKVPVTIHSDGLVDGDPTKRQTITTAAFFPRYYRTGQNGASPQIALSTNALDFGQVTVNETASKTLVVANTGFGPLTVSAMNLSDESQFQQNGGAVSLDPGYEMDVTVSFTPTATGSQAATLTVVSDDPTTAQLTVQLSGQGAAAPGPTPPKGPCFVATAAYGSYLDPHVATLRSFRDRHLLTNAPGRAFVAAYYRCSPPIAAVIARHETLRMVTRWALTPAVLAVQYPEPTVVAVVVLVGGLVLWRYRCRRVGCKRPI